MSGQDTELEQLRAGVSCAVLLERGGYQIDKGESTARCQKWRRGSGEIVIVNHDGRGWWDPQRPGTDRTGKGDVFTLAQYLDPGLNFGHVRKLLRGLVGLAPSYPMQERRQAAHGKPAIPVADLWAWRSRLRHGSATWCYLTGERALPAAVLAAADRFDAVREGPHGSAWFAHRDQTGALTGIDMRGPDWRGFSKSSDKSLFRLPGEAAQGSGGEAVGIGGGGGTDTLTRLAVCEAPIDALSLAALEGLRADTLYVSTTGGMGPLTLACLQALLQDLAAHPEGVLAAATDADAAGERYAAHLMAMAQAAGVRSERLVPSGGQNDWNDQLKQRDGRGS